jgi:transposase
MADVTPESWTFRRWQLVRYSLDTKLAAVESYEAGQQGLIATALRYEVDVSSLRQWVSRFRAHGLEGIRQKRKQTYGQEFKLAVLQRARDEGLSHRQVAALFNIRRFNIIGDWERAYAREGMPGLVPYRGGRQKLGSEKESNRSEPAEAGSDEIRSRRELLGELKELRLENAYLKKVDALVQARVTSARAKKLKS